MQQPPLQRSAKSLGGLRRAPLSGGVKTATARYDLPAPCVAVRNLVEQAQFAHLCTIMSQMHHRWVEAGVRALAVALWGVRLAVPVYEAVGSFAWCCQRWLQSSQVCMPKQRHMPPPRPHRNASSAHPQSTQTAQHTTTNRRRRSGYPFGTLVDFASDGAGMPIFCLSPLAIHARNLIEDPRCSLVVQMPGWTGLANARVTIFGDVYQLPANMQVGDRGGRLGACRRWAARCC